MSAWLRIALLETRFSAVTRALPLLLAVGAVIVISSQTPGLYGWADRASTGIVALTVLVPLLAAFAALDGTRLRRHNLGAAWRGSVDRGARAVLALTAAQLVAASATFAAVALVAHLPIRGEGVPVGGPFFLWLTAGLAATWVATGLGLVAGVLVPFAVTVIAVPVVAYAFCGFLVVLYSTAVPPIGRLSPTFQTLLDPSYRLDLGFFAWQAAWFVSVASVLAGLSLCVIAPSSQRRWLATSAAMALAIVFGAAVVKSPHPVSSDVQAEPFVCEGSTPSLCLTPTFEPARDRIEPALVRARMRVADTPLVFDRVEVRPRGLNGDARDGAVALHVDDLGDGWAVRDITEMVSGILTPRGSFCAEIAGARDGGEFDGLRAVVAAWAGGDDSLLAGNPDTLAAVEKLASLSREKRANWLASTRESVCEGSTDLSLLRS